MRSQQGAGDYCLQPDQVKKLIYSTDNFRNRTIIKTLAYTGIRREELTGLDIEDIDFDLNRIRIRAGKGNKERMVPASQNLLPDIKFLIETRKIGPVFLSERKGRLMKRQINRIVARAGEKAELKNPNPRLKNINPHILRHSYGRLYLKAGGKMERLQQILGHSSVNTTIGIYGVPSMNDIQEEFEDIFEDIYG